MARTCAGSDRRSGDRGRRRRPDPGARGAQGRGRCGPGAADRAPVRRASPARRGPRHSRPAARCAGLGAEIALARRVSPHQGNRHLGVALALTREMPHTLAAFSAGEISEWRATLVVARDRRAVAEHRAEVDVSSPTSSTGSGYGDRGLAEKPARSATAWTPAPPSAGPVARRRPIRLRAAGAGHDDLPDRVPARRPGRRLPTPRSPAADTAGPQGDDRTRGQIMADTLVERVTGRSSAAAHRSRSRS